MFSDKYKVLAMIAFAAIVACSPALYLPTPELAQSRQIPIEHLNQGRKLYIEHCGSCHRLYLPAQFQDNVWRMMVDSMQPRAKINTSQKLLVLDYILSGK
ncbi:MAG: cytochrome c [bacterium]